MEPEWAEHRYTVSGGVGGTYPGGIGPAEVEAEREWQPVQRDPGLVGRVATRLGSEANARRVILAVLAPLRGALRGAPLEAVLARLPPRLATELLEAEWNLNARIPEATGAREYLATVSGLSRFPPRTAATYVLAVFGALRAALWPAEADAVAERLPADLATLWRAAR
jgi:uncharacterized protein (DUF2267 family)